MKLLLLLGAMIAFNATAGEGTVGNGGNAVVCYKNSTKKEIVSIELFDYWEMSQVNPQFGEVQLGAPNLSVKEKVAVFINRVNKVDPELAKRIATVANSIVDNLANYLDSTAEIPDVDDDHPAVKPKAPCYMDTFAIQWTSVQNGRRFMIKAKLFNHPKTSNDDRAGIILHEAIYRVGILNGSKDSDGVRYFNHLIATDHSKTLSTSEYVKLLKETNLNMGSRPCYITETNVGPVYIPVNPSYGFAANMSLCLPHTITTPFDTIVNSSAYVWFMNNADKIVYRIRSFGEATLTLNRNTPKQKTLKAKDGDIVFYPTGRIEYLTGVSDSAFDIDVLSKNYKCGSSVVFTESGILVSCGFSPNSFFELFGEKIYATGITTNGKGAPIASNLAKNSMMKIKGASQKTMMKGAIEFYPDGEVKAGYLATPLLVPFRGASVSVDSIKHGNKSEILGYISYKQPSLLQGNLPVLKTVQESAICKSYGFITTETVSSEAKEIYVTGAQNFFDHGLNKIVTKTDEYVVIFTSLNCRGYIPLKI